MYYGLSICFHISVYQGNNSKKEIFIKQKCEANFARL
jgi:hypothetical protein